MYTLIEIYRSSGRPTGNFELFRSKRDAEQAKTERTYGNNILSESWVIVAGTLEQNTYTDNQGFLKWNK